MTSYRTFAAVALSAAAMLVGGCGGEAQREPRTVSVDGSSTVYPITEAVAEEFEAANAGVRVVVGLSGTSGGFQRFGRGETDISNASRPIKPTEVEACRAAGIEYIELPVAFDGLSVVVHPNNTWCDYLTVEELREIWRPGSTIERWSQVREGWPDRPLRLFGAGHDSGTFDYFTAAIVGEEGQCREDFTASEDDNVLVQGVAGTEEALGFFGYAYYVQNSGRLRVVPIDDGDPTNGDGPIEPSDETIADGTYQPLSRPVFIYVNRAAAERSEVAGFVEFYLEHAGALAAEVGYIALPDRAYELAMNRFEQRRTGSMFGGAGSTIGVRIEDLLAAEESEGGQAGD